LPVASSSSKACVMLRRYHGATSVGSGMAIILYLAGYNIWLIVVILDNL
jgi:hypothetical protein